ncbi:MAG: helix-turn-helix domain-containing protein [Bacilli bacterium]|jgi:transcriptional regulator with XRE-family HTH domain|nr:helix-turn-helix domain-containing protein [Bacilli bacterium]MCH4201945.1 helix-turn-helix domain-containing protein [Bacilli bacterium]MCH4235890.1 helix-turn-helix domain-containing protein [Bacilli bacterium]HMM00441.1 helix-turn-helix transcriptional regulator [Bacilli bacterium]
MKKAFLNRLRGVRKSRHITLGELAKSLNISKAYLSMIENGRRSLDYVMAVKIAKFFGLLPDQLFYVDFALN